MRDFLIGHSQNEQTGVSVIICLDGAIGGVSVRGGAPGTRETDLLKPENMVERVNAVVLSGGSAFGLESCSGVMRWLYENKAGFNAGTQIVPIVCGAVIYDLMPNKLVYPDLEMGYEAAKLASEDNLASGRIGAGRGATVGKIRAPLGVDGGGLGVAVVEQGELFVGAMVAVNALGDVFRADSDQILAGARLDDGSFLNTERMILGGARFRGKEGANTTIGTIFTNAKMTKAMANKLADISHDALARCIRPVHTNFDGDTMFALSSNKVDFDFNALCVLALRATTRAIENAVTRG